MPHARIQELAVKLVDADVTQADPTPPEVAGLRGEDTLDSPGLRPEVLGDAAQRQTKAMIHAALFKKAGEATAIGPYQVQRLLGEGGMGVVYAAYDEALERKVALKLIRGAALRRPEGRARTLREARALARLSHPNVVHVYQVGEVDGEIYVAMEFLTGPTLRAWLAAQPRAWWEVLAVLRQAGEGLAAAHRQGVIHRDFKPANVIVGDDGRVRVLDFGLAHFFGLEGEAGEEGDSVAVGSSWTIGGGITDVLLTQTGAVLGTPAYMAAEQFAGGRGDAKTDQFSFCTALYEALYGQRPFVGDQLEVLASAVRAGRVVPVKPRGEVPAWLHRVVMRGLLPEPAARWPSMDALLLALRPPEPRVRWRAVAGAMGATCTLLLAGIGYVFTLDSSPGPGPGPAVVAAAEIVEDDEAAAWRRSESLAAQDGSALMEARALLRTDPLMTIRLVAMLAGDATRTWDRARFLASAAAARGLPVQVLRADRALLEAWPLAGGGFVGREDLGAVVRWNVSEGTGSETLPGGPATQLVVARDVPVWAAIEGRTARVVGGGRDQTIAVGEPMFVDWRLGSDGRALVATDPGAGTGGQRSVVMWDLTRPGTPPRTIAVTAEVVIAEDAAIVVVQEARGMRVVWAREGREKLLAARGRPLAVSADGRFVVAAPADKDGVMEVVEVASGKVRRTAAEAVTVLSKDEVLLTRTERGRAFVRREALANGAVAWRMPLPGHAGPRAQRLVVDAGNEQFAVAVGDAWGVGDLRRGELSSFVTVPKDSSPQWAGPGELLVIVGHELRIHRPETATVQLRGGGASCGLAPGGRWAVRVPEDLRSGEVQRVELATNEVVKFRCPGPAKLRGAAVTAMVDDAGQVALLGSEGGSCWWDAEHGARAGARAGAASSMVALPRGVALAQGAEVELWSGPETRAQRWTAAGTVVDLTASPTGERLAVRSERGVQVLHVADGAVRSVSTWTGPTGQAELLASALAWSPDGGRLAVLDKVGAALELSVWDVAGEPYEVQADNLVTLGGHVLEDSPGRASNRLSFTPGGAAVTLTNRHESLLRVDLQTHETKRIEVPDLRALVMRSETEAVGIDGRDVPIMIDFTAWEVSPLTPNPELGGAARPQLRAGADGKVWSCGALGPGTLLEVDALEDARGEALRARLYDRALFL